MPSAVVRLLNDAFCPETDTTREVTLDVTKLSRKQLSRCALQYQAQRQSLARGPEEERLTEGLSISREECRLG